MSNNKDASLGQASHTLTLLSQTGITAGELKTLHNGYLTDLIESIQKGTVPSRDCFREAVGLDPLSFQMRVNYDIPLEEALVQSAITNRGELQIPEHLKYEWQGNGVFDHDMEIIPMDFLNMKNTAAPEVVVHLVHTTLASELRKKGFRLAHFAELIEFAKRFKTLRERTRLVSLGGGMAPNNLPVPCLERDDDRGVRLIFVKPSRAIFYDDTFEPFRALIVKI